MLPTLGPEKTSTSGFALSSKLSFNSAEYSKARGKNFYESFSRQKTSESIAGITLIVPHHAEGSKTQESDQGIPLKLSLALRILVPNY
jgi:hypothetical protein